MHQEMSEDDAAVGTQLRCQHCGHRVPAGDNFCTECGTPAFPEVQRRPLFADEVNAPAERTPRSPAPPVDPPPPIPRPTPATSSAAPPTTHVVPGGQVVRRRRGGIWLLVLLLLLVAAGVGYLVGHGSGDEQASPSTAQSTGTGTPAASQPTTDPTGPAATAASPAETQPQDQLQKIAGQDDDKVRRLVGSWVPQLAALTPGAGGDQSWSQALLHYRKLKDTYPSALLLDTGKWPHSYEHGGMYAVVVPQPGPTSKRALRWCNAHVPGSPHDCAAKLLDTRGSWADNFDAGKPGPG